MKLTNKLKEQIKKQGEHHASEFVKWFIKQPNGEAKTRDEWMKEYITR